MPTVIRINPGRRTMPISFERVMIIVVSVAFACTGNQDPRREGTRTHLERLAPELESIALKAGAGCYAIQYDPVPQLGFLRDNPEIAPRPGLWGEEFERVVLDTVRYNPGNVVRIRLPREGAYVLRKLPQDTSSLPLSGYAFWYPGVDDRIRLERVEEFYRVQATFVTRGDSIIGMAEYHVDPPFIGIYEAGAYGTRFPCPAALPER
jgi:hypothetical protein